MATKKELDDMLNDLTNNSKPAKKKKKDEQDNSSLDDLLNALDDAENAQEVTEKKVRRVDPKEKTQVFGKKPASPYDRKFGKKLKPIPDTPIERPVYPDDEPSPVKKKKMKIVISGELPDYEAIRQQELEKDKAAKAAEEAQKAEAAAAEEARLAAEKIAENRRLEEEKAKKEAKRAARENQRKAEEKAKEEAIIAEKRRQAEEKAKEEARAAAERMRLAEEKAAEEERIAAEKKRLEEEKAAEEARIAAEAKRIAEKKAAKIAEKKKRIAEQKARLAAEEAALEADEEDAFTVSEDSALKALAESEDALPDEELPPAASLEDEDVPADAADELDEAIEALGAAAAEPDDFDVFEDDPEFAAYAAKQKAKAQKKTEKKGLLAKIKSLFSSDVFDEDEQAEFEDEPLESADADVDEDDEQMFGQDDNSETDDLVNEAIAAINEEPVISADEAVTEEDHDAPAETESSADEFSIEEITEDETDAETVSEAAEEASDAETEDISGEDEDSSILEEILDEDPEELVRSQSEQAEFGTHPLSMRNIKAKRRRYAVLGVVCAFFALIGICAVIVKGIGMVRNVGSANDKKDRFTHVIYPAAIMDIDAFNTPSELSSEQIITATLWSIIMDKNKIGNYESQLGDTVSIPDVDVEKYAVELFGENIPAFEHCTVGPVEARFYYSNGAYNVKLRPITFTYAPDVRSVVKSGDIYTLTVDYIDELPEWMPKSVAKTVEYQLTEKNDGTYTIDSMRIISVKSSNL